MPRGQDSEESSERNPLGHLNPANAGHAGYGSVDADSVSLRAPEHRASIREPSAGDGESDGAETMHTTRIARRLRCIFQIITWPIAPLTVLVFLALVYYLASFVSDMQKTCSQPLRLYVASTSLVLGYVCIHDRVRAYLLTYTQDDLPNATSNHNLTVRRYEQIVHTIGLLYVYAGMTLVQACSDDTTAPPTSSEETAVLQSTCDATCPWLFRGTVFYVAVLEGFVCSIMLPLFLLPCIYLWFLRHASSDRDIAAVQDRFRDEDILPYLSANVTSDDILKHSLETVTLHRNGPGEDDIFVHTGDETSRLALPKRAMGSKECCICMNEFAIHNGEDVETGPSQDDLCSNQDVVIRTRPCGHLFHKECMASWIGGRWREESDDETWRKRRAKRTSCPLCRRSLVPST